MNENGSQAIGADRGREVGVPGRAVTVQATGQYRDGRTGWRWDPVLEGCPGTRGPVGRPEGRSALLASARPPGEESAAQAFDGGKIPRCLLPTIDNVHRSLAGVVRVLRVLG